MGLILTGCAATRGGADADEVATAVERHVKITDVKVSHREISQSFGSTTIVVLTADRPRDTVANVSGFTEELLKAAYSVRNWKPSGGVRVVLRDHDGAPLGSALEQSGWKVVGWDESDTGTVFVSFSEPQERYGKWPSRIGPA
ncbi:hypothetical protein [Curtobacterium sp. 260]|uniref:hypothetical protein n=1 Tax=Curtobacterium sp. 260 TaxID=2817748 RepID=UPI002787C93B|nr:hypothetical protein [Curtobacterium sp. 260]MDP9737790.1 hypothetical protein [Curtobacterium sp. 260]